MWGSKKSEMPTREGRIARTHGDDAVPSAHFAPGDARDASFPTGARSPVRHGLFGAGAEVLDAAGVYSTRRMPQASRRTHHEEV